MGARKSSQGKEATKMIITVDGPTASGKGTISKALATHFGLPLLETGLIYRAVGRQVELNFGDPSSKKDAIKATAFPESLLVDPILRDEKYGGLASEISIHPEVRERLLSRQRNFANQVGGAVLDGRDTGTVVAPHADIKFFVTADADVRAERRLKEMSALGISATFASILEDLKKRDLRDKSRANSPLVVPDGAFVIDTTNQSADESRNEAINIVLSLSKH